MAGHVLGKQKGGKGDEKERGGMGREAGRREEDGTDADGRHLSTVRWSLRQALDVTAATSRSDAC